MADTIKGKVSHFGGPADTGVTASEDLAWWETWDQVTRDRADGIFLPTQPPGTSGMARRLDPESFYIACRWDYDTHPKSVLKGMSVLVRANGREFTARCADWGPHGDTNRVADISPGLMSALGITTDDTVEVIIQDQQETTSMPYKSIVISSGHGKYVRGASSDMLDEVDEARKVTEAVATELRRRGVEVFTFHDDTSKDQNTNLNTITNFHNSKTRQLDVSVHFNAFEQTSAPRGTEVLYLSQSQLAGQVSAAIASVGFTNRGGKKNTGLFWLNNTDMPAILLEICFVDSVADCDVYGEEFDLICSNIADVLGGQLADEIPPVDPDEPVTTPPEQAAVPRVDIEVSGEVLIFVNGEQVGTKG